MYLTPECWKELIQDYFTKVGNSSDESDSDNDFNDAEIIDADDKQERNEPVNEIDPNLTLVEELTAATSARSDKDELLNTTSIR